MRSWCVSGNLTAETTAKGFIARAKRVLPLWHRNMYGLQHGEPECQRFNS